MTEPIQTITNALQKSYAICSGYQKIMVSISGGSDSDVMLDLILQTVPKEKLTFVFFDTGIEYAATKRHLDYLEEHYGIKIDRQRASVPVPLGCKTYGLPFISKFISEMIERLQKHGFDFAKDGPKSYDELIKKYPKLGVALTWWTNSYPAQEGKKSQFNIDTCYGLKEFLMTYPPDFRISSKCCNGAKKNTSHDYERKHKFDLKCVGLRKQEGGVRATRFKSCFEYQPKNETQSFRPIWHFDDTTKSHYIAAYSVKLSDCYTIYGMKRTGCVGCPFNSRFEDDLEIVREHEPALYKAAINIFGQSYEYTRKYREFKKGFMSSNGEIYEQIRME